MADEASRFRGSAPIGGYDSARQSVGTTVGKRAPPLRTARYTSVGADASVRPTALHVTFCRGRCPHRPARAYTAVSVMCHCEASAHTGCGNPFSSSLVQRGLRMTLLRCPKFLRCLTADAGNFDRGHSLTSLLLPLAALGSLPTASLRTGLAMTGYKRCCGAGGVEPRPYGGVARGVGKESPSHGFAVPAPFRQGGRRDGGCGLPHQ